MKTNNTIKLLLLSFIATGACGNQNSGLDRSKRVDSLSVKERSALCAWQTNEVGGPDVDKDCGGEVTAHVATIASCESEAAAKICTVAEVEDCIISLHGDPCQLDRANACKPGCELGIAISLP